MGFPRMRAGVMKRRGNNFRYLHDEISGGVFSYSHLKVNPAYVGACVNIGTAPNQTDYGFIDNIVDLTQVNADFGSTQEVNNLYDQVGSNSLGSGGYKWIKPDNEYPDFSSSLGALATSVGSLSTLSGAFTTIKIIKHNDVARKTNEWILNSNGGNNIRIGYNSTTQYSIILATGSTTNRIEKRYNLGDGFPFDNNIHIIITTYDGSELASGIDTYCDNVSIPITESTSGNIGSYTNTAPFPSIRVGFLGTTGSDYRGLVYEVHVFNRVLDATERQTVKEILQQYPLYATIP